MDSLTSVRLVGSGRLGLGITDPYDCSVYLVQLGGIALLVDAGCGRAPDRILERIGTTPVDAIVLTHGHADHAGGAGVLARELGAEVWAPAGWADALERGDEDAVGLADARAAGIYPADYGIAPCRIDRRYAAGPLVAGFDALATPGHCHDHFSLLADVDGHRVAFAGDLVFAGGRVVLPPPPDGDAAALGRSLDALARRAPDALLAGHGEPVLDAAIDHISRAREALAAGRPLALAT